MFFRFSVVYTYSVSKDFERLFIQLFLKLFYMFLSLFHIHLQQPKTETHHILIDIFYDIFIASLSSCFIYIFHFLYLCIHFLSFRLKNLQSIWLLTFFSFIYFVSVISFSKQSIINIIFALHGLSLILYMYTNSHIQFPDFKTSFIIPFHLIVYEYFPTFYYNIYFQLSKA